MRWLVVGLLGAGALSGCSFDFKGFTSGAGGAGGSSLTTNVGPQSGANVTSSGVTSPTTSVGPSGSSTTGAAGGAGGAMASATSSSASSGSGGGGPLAACAGITDDFATFPSATWTTNGTATSAAGTAKLQVVAPDNWAGAWHDTAAINDCALTIDLVMPPSSGAMYLNIHQDPNDATFGYDEASAHMLSLPNGQNKNLQSKPDALGIALSGGNIYYLYRMGGTWTVAGFTTRPSWMDGAEAIGFGIGASQNMKNATFDNFNLTPVTPADL